LQVEPSAATRAIASIGAVQLILACGSPAPSEVRVISRTPEGGHRLVDVTLSTAPDLDRLSSPAITMRGGGRIVIDGLRFQRLGASPDQTDVRRLARDDPGAPVRFRYTLDGDVAVPDDYESLLMASAYHGLEQVRDFLRRYDLTMATRSTIEVCFACGLYVDVLLPLPFIVSDNAAYVPSADLLALVPELLLSEVPIAADAAILCHELSHRVFRYNVYPDEVFARVLDDFVHQAEMTPDEWRILNLLQAIDEGSADFLAATFSGDPRFTAASLGASGEADRRDLEGERARAEVYDAVFDEAAAQRRGVETALDGGHALGGGGRAPCGGSAAAKTGGATSPACARRSHRR